MLRAAAAASLLLAAGGAPPPRPPVPDPGYGRVIIREQIVVRISQRGGGAIVADGNWKEKKGPRCIAARALAGAAVSSPRSVDFLLRDGSRVRARLENRCPALDYYYGFYITPNPDGMVCAERDSIRSRVGGQCGIDRFRRLQATGGE